MTRRASSRAARVASRAPAALVLALLVAPAFAAAPTDQYAPFNREDTVIVDQNTGLHWLRQVGGPSTEAQAASACSSQAMRLPSMTELETIVDENVHREYDFTTGQLVEKAIDVNAFPDTPAGLFWTQSPQAGSGSSFWSVDFGTGENKTIPASTPLSYRCVSP